MAIDASKSLPQHSATSTSCTAHCEFEHGAHSGASAVIISASLSRTLQNK
jgi:hypothetical protein